MVSKSSLTKVLASEQSASPWTAALNKLREWDPAWAELWWKLTTILWRALVFPAKFAKLVSVVLNAPRTNLNRGGPRRHIRAALAAGASRNEILFVLKCASVMSIHSCSFNAPVLVQEASVSSLDDFRAIRKRCLEKAGKETLAVEKMKAIGHWTEEWDSIFFL